jgi:SP family facilitated glucose transporter-like MFS transporter 8
MGTFIESWFWFNFSCAILPLIFASTFIFMPESPYFLVKTNNDEAALKALEWLRGSNYDSKRELTEIKEEIENQQEAQVPIKEAFGRRSTKRGLIIAFGLVAAVQLSGINAVLFYTATIFKDAGVGLSSDLSTIIVGLVQAFTTLGASAIVDKAGRKILLLISSVVMSICLVLLGVFYFLKNIDGSYAESMALLPLISLSVYTVAFSIGNLTCKMNN